MSAEQKRDRNESTAEANANNIGKVFTIGVFTFVEVDDEENIGKVFTFAEVSDEENDCNHDEEKNSNKNNQDEDGDDLESPQSCGERFRDSILRTLDHPFFQALGLIVLFLVIVDGAFFFFLLVGWHSMCRSRTDCESRNWWYNFSIHVLNALFTYMSTVSMPWRSTNFLHIIGWSCPYRNNSPGHDLYGRAVSCDIWFHIPRGKRLGITTVLLWNCLFQYANQATRIRYYSFEMQGAFPGSLWTNIFFGLSFLCGFIGGAWMGYEVYVLRKANPKQFGPGPVELVRTSYTKTFGKKQETSNDEGEASGDGDLSHIDPTREKKRRSLVPTSRSSMRMFAC